MNYTSTRSSLCVSFKEAFLEGLARDKGLYIPTRIPTLSIDSCSYLETSCKIFSLFCDLDSTSLYSILENSFFSFTFKDVVSIHNLDQNTCILELFHGPTFAFKDIALQVIANLLNHYKVTDKSVIVATSGDTGGAAIYAFKNTPLNIFVLFPLNRISSVQFNDIFMF